MQWLGWFWRGRHKTRGDEFLAGRKRGTLASPSVRRQLRNSGPAKMHFGSLYQDQWNIYRKLLVRYEDDPDEDNNNTNDENNSYEE